MDVLARTTVKAAAKCDKHYDLQDSMSHLKVEHMLFFKTHRQNTDTTPHDVKVMNRTQNKRDIQSPNTQTHW